MGYTKGIGSAGQGGGDGESKGEAVVGGNDIELICNIQSYFYFIFPPSFTLLHKVCGGLGKEGLL